MTQPLFADDQVTQNVTIEMRQSSDPLLAWHWIRTDRLTQYPHDGDRRVAIEAGQTLRYDGAMVVGATGLHASVAATDSLEYAPGPVVCRVACWGEIVHAPTAFVAQRRAVVWMADATTALGAWVCDAIDALLRDEAARGAPPDPRSLAAASLARRALREPIDPRELAAACDASAAAMRETQAHEQLLDDAAALAARAVTVLVSYLGKQPSFLAANVVESACGVARSLARAAGGGPGERYAAWQRARSTHEQSLSNALLQLRPEIAT